MPGEILAGLAGAILPSIGAQAAAQQQRRWALEDLEAQNLYNSPREQLRRLKDAGLPAASFFSGGVSSQSDQPRSTNVDPTMGVAEGMQNFFQNRMQTQQLALLKAQTRKMDAEAGEAEGRTAWLQQPTNNFLGPQMNNQAALLDIQKEKADADRAAANSVSQIQQIIADRKDEQMTSEIQRANSATELARQQFTNNEDFLSFQRAFVKGIHEGKDFWGTFKSLLSMWLLKQNR